MFTLYCGHYYKESFQVQGPVYDNMLVFKVGHLPYPKLGNYPLSAVCTYLCNVQGPNFIQQLLFAASCCTHHVWAVSLVGYINIINKPTGSGNLQLLSKTMTLYLQLLFVSGGFLMQMQPEDMHCEGNKGPT
jgi:hypothetical protein